MANRRRAPHRKKTKARGPRKPGYAEIAICSAQMLSKGPHGGVVWQPIVGFLEQMKDFATEHGATLGRYMERYTHDAINAFKHRGLVLVDYKRNMMRMTAKGNTLIREVLTEIDESGETFATDLERFYAACALFKKALQPLNRRSKAELVAKLEILLGSPRMRDGNESDTESDGTDTDSIMEDVDQATDRSISPAPEPTVDPVTPFPRIFNQPTPDLGATPRPIGLFNGYLVSPIRKAASMGDPRLAYPSPESAPRRLGPQRSLYFTPPPSPTPGAAQSDDVLMEDEDEQAMDIDDNPPLASDPSEDLPRSISNLREEIEALNANLADVNISKQRLEDTIKILQGESADSEILRNSLRAQIFELQNEREADARTISVLDQSIQRSASEDQIRNDEMAQLRAEMKDITAKNKRLQEQVLKYEDKSSQVMKIINS